MDKDEKEGGIYYMPLYSYVQLNAITFQSNPHLDHEKRIGTYTKCHYDNDGDDDDERNLSR